jgi:dTDP-4-dehydrorhamnose 3,5-epimerase-like enzyme
MKKIIIDDTFASIQNEEKSTVLEIIPNVFNDARGYFTEVFK